MKFKDFDNNQDEIAVKIIKLISGEMILCRAPDCTGSMITIYCPMQVIQIDDDVSSGESSYVMSPWIPFAVDQTLELNKSAIILITDVYEEMANEYLDRVVEFMNGGVEEDEEPPAEPPILGLRQCTHQWK